MKNNKIIFLLFSLALISSLWGNEKELFPLGELFKLYDSEEKVRETIEKIREKTATNYPKLKLRSPTASSYEILYYLSLEDNKYWNKVSGYLGRGKLVALFYNWNGKEEQTEAHLSLTLKTVFAVLGKDFDLVPRKTRYSGDGALLVWEKDDHYITFWFAPPSLYVSDRRHKIATRFSLGIIGKEKEKGSLWENLYLHPEHRDHYYASTTPSWVLYHPIVNLIKDKKRIEKVKKECEAYFSSLEE